MGCAGLRFREGDTASAKRQDRCAQTRETRRPLLLCDRQGALLDRRPCLGRVELFAEIAQLEGKVESPGPPIRCHLRSPRLQCSPKSSQHRSCRSHRHGAGPGHTAFMGQAALAKCERMPRKLGGFVSRMFWACIFSRRPADDRMPLRSPRSAFATRRRLMAARSRVMTSHLVWEPPNGWEANGLA